MFVLKESAVKPFGGRGWKIADWEEFQDNLEGLEQFEGGKDLINWIYYEWNGNGRELCILKESNN